MRKLEDWTPEEAASEMARCGTCGCHQCRQRMENLRQIFGDPLELALEELFRLAAEEYEIQTRNKMLLCENCGGIVVHYYSREDDDYFCGRCGKHRPPDEEEVIA